MKPPAMPPRSEVSGRCPFALAALSKPLNDMTSRLGFAFLNLKHAEREHSEERHVSWGCLLLFISFNTALASPFWVMTRGSPFSD